MTDRTRHCWCSRPRWRRPARIHVEDEDGSIRLVLLRPASSSVETETAYDDDDGQDISEEEEEASDHTYMDSIRIARHTEDTRPRPDVMEAVAEDNRDNLPSCSLAASAEEWFHDPEMC